MSLRSSKRLVRAGLAVPGLAVACYTYTPLATTPEPASHVSVVLSDFGRLHASSQIGPQADRVEGAVVATSDSGYLLAVSGVKLIQGDWVKWTGETVSVRRDYVASVYRRDLSKSKTAFVVAGAAAALAAAIVTFDIFGIGQDKIETIPDGGGGDPGEN